MYFVLQQIRYYTTPDLVQKTMGVILSRRPSLFEQINSIDYLSFCLVLKVAAN